MEIISKDDANKKEKRFKLDYAKLLNRIRNFQSSFPYLQLQ